MPVNLSKGEIGLLRELANGHARRVVGELPTKSPRHGLARLVKEGYVLATTTNPPETIFEITDAGRAALEAVRSGRRRTRSVRQHA